MKAYVAGRVTDVENVRNVQSLCREKGFEISFDWTRAGEEVVDESYWDTHLQQASVLAEKEVEGVRNCNVLVAVYKDGTGLGKYIEIGIAVALNKPILLLGDFRKHLFWHLSNIVRLKDFEELSAALDALKKMPVV